MPELLKILVMLVTFPTSQELVSGLAEVAPLNKFVILLYLQFLFSIGMFQSKKTWIDKQITSCYNKLKDLGHNIDQITDIGKLFTSNAQDHLTEIDNLLNDNKKGLIGLDQIQIASHDYQR